MAAACTEEEFISLWHQHQSCAALARILNVDVRNVQIRRRRIEQNRSISLAATTNPKSPDFQVTLPANGVRVGVDIDDGVILIGSDCHYWPGIVSTAHRAFVVAAKELRPKMVVINGDAFDGAQISRHDRIGWDVRPTVKQELEAVTDRLGEIEAVTGAKMHWTFGNHDMRFNTRLASHAAQFEGVRGFSLQDHFMRWKFSTSIMVNGHTMIKHRWHNGVHATWNNVLKAGTSMVTGHLHALQYRPYTDYKGTRYAVDTGTLACPTGAQFDYAEDSPSNHRSGFAVLTFHKGKLLPPELLEVVDEDEGLVCFRGQVIHV